MNALGPDLPGARVVDLFAGSGALGLEALSRGAAHVTFVERDGRVLECLKANIAALDALDETDVSALDVFEYLRRRVFYDIALADPPYGHGHATRLITRFIEEPFARLLCIEHGAREKVPTPEGVVRRRYGDTVITFVTSGDIDMSEEDK
jgi:16S rRNA (guanine966-N2)-methyltransferase